MLVIFLLYQALQVIQYPRRFLLCLQQLPIPDIFQGSGLEGGILVRQVQLHQAQLLVQVLSESTCNNGCDVHYQMPT